MPSSSTRARKKAGSSRRGASLRRCLAILPTVRGLITGLADQSPRRSRDAPGGGTLLSGRPAIPVPVPVPVTPPMTCRRRGPNLRSLRQLNEIDRACCRIRECVRTHRRSRLAAGGTAVNRRARDGSVMSWGTADAPAPPGVAVRGNESPSSSPSLQSGPVTSSRSTIGSTAAGSVR